MVENTLGQFMPLAFQCMCVYVCECMLEYICQDGWDLMIGVGAGGYFYCISYHGCSSFCEAL